MVNILISSLVAFVVCLLLVPQVRTLAISLGLYDKPGKLKIHGVATPRIGGVAMMTGIIVATVFSLQVVRGPYAVAVAVLGAVWLLGLVDDVWNLPPVVRLIAHLALGAILWSQGWQLHWFSLPVFDLLATTLLFAFLINAMNLLDGMDGLALSVSSVIAIGFIVLTSSNASGFSVWLAGAILGVCLGGLIHNYPPASIFIGDSGSTLLGAAIAILCLDWVRIGPESHSVLLPLLFVSLPIGDVVVAMIRRIRARKSPFDGDRRHYYDLLLQKGWSVKAILLVSNLVTSVLIIAAWLCFWRTLELWMTMYLLFTLLGLTAYLLGSFRPDVTAYGSETEISAVRDGV